MKKALLLSIVLFVILTGCSNEHKITHELDCVLHSVINTKTDQETVFKREDAIKRGFSYYFRLYDDATMSVNDNDHYVQDNNRDRTYSLKLEEKINHNMQFVFNKNYDDPYFSINDKDIKYTYTCIKINKK